MTTYGIIGGLGSRAGVNAVERFNGLFSHVSAEMTDESFPRTLYYQIPFAGVDHGGFTKDREVVKEIGREIVNAAKVFESAGVTSVMFACNTYSAVADMVFEKSNMTHFSLHQALEDGSYEHRKTLLLSSQQRAEVIRERKVEKNFDFLNETDQLIVNTVIDKTIRRGFYQEGADALSEIVNVRSQDYDVDAAVLACTELSMYFHHLKINEKQDLSVWDTVERVLVNMIAKG